MRLEVELPDAVLSAIAARVADLLDEREERWLSQEGLADHFSVSVRTVQNWRRAGMPHLMAGSHPRYRPSECEAWLRAGGGSGRIASNANGAAPQQRPAPGTEGSIFDAEAA